MKVRNLMMNPMTPMLNPTPLRTRLMQKTGGYYDSHVAWLPVSPLKLSKIKVNINSLESGINIVP